MAEKPRDACVESAILSRWVTLRLNFRLKGYVPRQYLWTVRWGNGYTYFAAGSFHTQQNFVADFIRLKLTFIRKNKNKKSPFDALFGGLWGNIRTPSITRSKARGRLLIRHNLTFFDISYG